MMPRAEDPNWAMLSIVAERLGPLLPKVVFLGGCATGLLITDEAAAPVRATRDVDLIVEIRSLADYHHLEESLRQLLDILLHPASQARLPKVTDRLDQITQLG